jgi:hypothetical protein
MTTYEVEKLKLEVAAILKWMRYKHVFESTITMSSILQELDAQIYDLQCMNARELVANYEE